MGCYDYFGTPFQKTVPLVYDESVSMAQQVAAIMGKLCELSQNEVTTRDLAELWDRFVADQTRQDGVLKGYTDAEVADLWAYLEEIADGWLIWDETKGGYSPNRDAIRHLFNDVTIHACTVEELAGWGDCEQLADSGLTVYGLAVYSWWLFGSNYVPYGVFTDGTTLLDVRDARLNLRNVNGYMEVQTSGPRFTVGDLKAATVKPTGEVVTDGTGAQTLSCAQFKAARIYEGRVKVIV